MTEYPVIHRRVVNPFTPATEEYSTVYKFEYVKLTRLQQEAIKIAYGREKHKTGRLTAGGSEGDCNGNTAKSLVRQGWLTRFYGGGYDLTEGGRMGYEMWLNSGDKAPTLYTFADEEDTMADERKFHVGQRVRLIVDAYTDGGIAFPRIGAIGEIFQVNRYASGNGYEVRWDGYPGRWHALETDLEPVAPDIQVIDRGPGAPPIALDMSLNGVPVDDSELFPDIEPTPADTRIPSRFATCRHGEDPANCPECTPHSEATDQPAASAYAHTTADYEREQAVDELAKLQAERDEAHAEVELLRAALEAERAIFEEARHFVMIAREIFSAMADPEHSAHNRSNWQEHKRVFGYFIERCNLHLATARIAAGEGETE